MHEAAYVVGIIGGLIGVISMTIAIGRWVGRRDGGEAFLGEDQKRARAETREGVKRIEDKIDKMETAMRPLLDWHATRAGSERALDDCIAEVKENRERIIRAEGKLDELIRGTRSAARTRKGG